MTKEDKSGFFVLGDTVRGFWIGWEGYPGEDFDPEAEADNELTWSELAETRHLDELWDSYAGESVTEAGITAFAEWLGECPSEVKQQLSARLRESIA